jgi:hypothetical protein
MLVDGSLIVVIASLFVTIHLFSSYTFRDCKTVVCFNIQQFNYAAILSPFVSQLERELNFLAGKPHTTKALVLQGLSLRDPKQVSKMLMRHLQNTLAIGPYMISEHIRHR